MPALQHQLSTAMSDSSYRVWLGTHSYDGEAGEMVALAYSPRTAVPHTNTSLRRPRPIALIQ